MTRLSLARAVALTAAIAVVPVARLSGFPWEAAALLWGVALWRALAGTEGRGLVRRVRLLPLQAATLLFAGYLLHRMASGDGAVLLGLLLLLTAVQTLLLLRPVTPFTAFLVVLVSTVHVSGAAFLVQDTVALGVTLAYVVFLVQAMVLFERDGHARVVPRARGSVQRITVGAIRQLPRGAVLRTVAALAALGLTGGILLYLVVPRGLLEVPAAQEDHAASADTTDDGGVVGVDTTSVEAFVAGAGTSTKGIRLGDIGTIKKDLTPFFEVQMPPGMVPRLREDTAEVYSAEGWGIYEGAAMRPLEMIEHDEQGWFELGRKDDPVRGFGLRIRVFRGPQKRFYLERDAVRVRMLRRGRALASLLRRQDNEQIESYLPLQAGDVIEERAVGPVRDPNALEAARSDASVAPRPSTLQFPAWCQPLVALAQGVVGGETNPWRRARLLEQWLESSAFTYTLEMPKVNRSRPVVDFLLKKRRGHCEYFASSLTLLLRALGHPARVVRGFRGGDYLEDRGTWMIRGLHYHAWTEMYFEGLGWIPLDATPPDRSAVDAERSITRVADASGADGDDRGLMERLLGYGPEERRALAGSIGRFLERTVGRSLAVAFGRRGWYAGWAVVGLLALVLLRRRRRVRVARNVGVSPKALPEGPYGRALALLARRGFRRRPPQTAREYQRAVGRFLPAGRAPLAWLTRLYERERFGGIAPDRDDLKKAGEQVHDLEAAAETRARRP